MDPCEAGSRYTEIIAYHGTSSEIEGDFWPGTCFSDCPVASLGYLRDETGWLYTVEITAYETAYDGDLTSTETDGLRKLPDDADLFCYPGGISPNGIEHLTYIVLEGATVRVLAVERVRRPA